MVAWIKAAGMGRPVAWELIPWVGSEQREESGVV